MAQEEVLLSELHEGVLTLTLNRPARRNALNAALVSALRSAIARAREDAAVRVVVLAASGDAAFCAGADLDPAVAAEGPLALHRGRETYATLLQEMGACGKPIVARVHAQVLAGGVGLVLASDLVVASPEASLQLPELKVGLFPMMVLALLVRHVGRKRALELLLSAEKMRAETMVDWGLYNRVVPRENLDEAVSTLARRMAGFSPVALQLGKDAFYAAEDQPVRDALAFLCGQLGVATMTEDAAEGIMAFMQKRPPEWKGR